MEEMGLDYELEVLPFPPRVHRPEYLQLNPLGTVPFMVDGETQMTESTGMCHYLVEKCQRRQFGLQPDHPEYGDYLNWLYHSDATLTFPQTLYLRYGMLEPDERKQPQVAEDYRQWYLARLQKLDDHISDREFLCDGRFTIADIAIGYALYLGEVLGIAGDYEPQTQAYLERLEARPGFVRAAEKE
jgi:glutathione S-transferase